MKKLSTSLAALAVAATLAGCSAAQANSEVSATQTSTTSKALTAMLAANQESHYSSDDSTITESSVVEVTLNGSSASATGDGVSIDGSTVTITAGGTYRLSGNLAGQVVVNADGEDVQVILNGVELTSSTGSPLVVEAADEVTLILAEGSNNSVTDAATYSDTGDDAPNAAIYSMADLSIAGTGSLSVTGNYVDGIVSKDGLVIAAGSLTVEAVDDGIRGKDYLIISGGTVTVTAEDDGLKSDNEEDADRGYVLISGGKVTVTAGDDGVKGYQDVGISGGTLTITKSYEGIEAQAIAIAGGTIDITSSDDGINVSGTSAQWVDIAGGTTTINAGGDGFDSNAAASMSDGTLIVYGPTNNGNGAIDVNDDFTVTGGTLWALGSSGMAESPSQSSTQAFVYANLNSATSGEVTITDSEGNELASITSPKQYSSVVYSSAEVDASGTYQILIDGNSAGTVSANQYATGMGGGGGGRRP